jgi:hypothetical protein
MNNLLRITFSVLLLSIIATFQLNAQCEIYNIHFELYDCDGDGNFKIDIEFDHVGTGAEGFSVFGNGNNYGSFSYDDPFITIGPLEGDGVSVYEFIIKDNQVDCSGTFGIDAPLCNCQITNFTLTPETCGMDSLFTVLVEFDYELPASDSFRLVDITPNLDILPGWLPPIDQTFAYSDLPFSVGPFLKDHQYLPNRTWKVWDAEDGDCHDTAELDYGCNCNFYNIETFLTDCNDEGEFFVTVDFDVANNFVNAFTILKNGDLLGSYPYDELPINLGPFTGNSDDIELMVVDTVISDCQALIEFGHIVCDPVVEDCKIYDVIAEIHPCEDDGTFFVDIDFEFENVGNEGFRIQGNGNNYGNFSYDEPFITLGPFDGSIPVLEFVVIDNQIDGCSDYVGIDVPNCDGPCEITNFVLEVGECKTQNSYELTILIEANNAPNDWVELSYGGLSLGLFHLADFPVTIPNFYDFGESSPLVFARIFESDCYDFASFDAPDCDDHPNDCFIGSAFSFTSQCKDDGLFDITLFFDIENAGNDFFEIFYAGELLGTYPIGQMPFNLDNFQPNNEPFPTLTICINDNPDCCRQLVLENPCYGNGCEMWDLIYEFHDCDDDGNYWMDIAFESNNTGIQGYSVLVNGTNHGSFSYDEPYVTVGPFEGDGSVNQMIIVDNEFQDCKLLFDYEAPQCSGLDCEIWDLVTDLGNCNDDGTYNLWVNFEYVNPIQDVFEVYAGNDLVGTYHFDELPIKIENFPINGSGEASLVVCFFSNNGECCEITEFQEPDCPVGDCWIEDFWIEVGDCNDDGTYPLWFSFEAISPTDDKFDLIYDGEIIGFYSISDLPINLSHFEGNGEPFEELKVCINDNPDCCATAEFEAPDCDGSSDCIILDPNIEPIECDDDGNFYLELNFEYEGNGTEGFSVYEDGQNLVGSFEYSELPITIGPLESGGDFIYHFLIKDNEFSASCQAEISFGPWFCDDECHINAVYAYPSDCNAEGEFFVTLDVLYQNIGTEGFKVQGNGNNYGNFGYDDLPITLGPFEGDGATEYEFVVIDLQIDDCQNWIAIEPVWCPPPSDCEIVELWTDVGDCNDDGTYGLWFNLEVINPGNDFIDVFAGDDFIGFFPLNDLPIFIENFPASGHPHDVLKVCINDNEDCCKTIEFDAPDCNLAWPGDANDDNIANNFDLLNIGLAYGTEGPSRPTQGIEWIGLVAEDWTITFENEVNFKHADCNGNGVVSDGDIEAILLNYDQTHGEVNGFEPVTPTDDDPAFFVDLPESEDIEFGVPFSAPIILGTDAQPLEDIYGIAFTINFDPEIINPSSIEISYDPSWIGAQPINLIKMDKTKAAEGKVEIAISRIDQNNVSGFGEIAAFIGIIDDIAGKQDMTVEISHVMAIKNNEVRIPLRTPVQTVELVTNVKEWTNDTKVNIYPNPTTDRIFIKTSDNSPIEFVEILDVNGRVIQRIEQPENDLSLDNFTSGMYILHTKVNGKLFFDRIIKMEKN